jgi:hypothetical protein
MADYSGESSGDESMEAAVAGKKPRGAVVKTIECPSGCGAIELTKLRPVEVQCDDCGVYVSHTWIENFGMDKNDVTRLRENHVKNINDEKNRKPSTEEEREKSKEYSARFRAKQRAERIAEELPEHQALYDGMTSKHRAKYDFPRDTHPEDMTKEERVELRKYKGTVAANLKYNTKAAADPEGERVKQKAARDAKPASTIEQKAEHAQYMKVYYDKNPGKRKANDDVQNAKKAKVAADEKAVLATTRAVPCPVCGTLATDVLAKNWASLRIVACVSADCSIFFSKDWQSDGIKGKDYNEVDKALRKRAESNGRGEENRFHAEAGREFEKLGDNPSPADLAEWSLKYGAPRSRNFKKPCVACTKPHESEYDTCRECRGLQERIKAYEVEVRDFFEENKLFYSLYDQKGACNREEDKSRADFVFDDNDAPNLVIVEVDENQHRDREIRCEIARMAGIRDQFAGRSIICIRYNPLRASESHTTDRKRILRESKVLLVDCVRYALQAAPSKSVLGYEQVFLGYDESRVTEIIETELLMHTEQTGTGSSSSTSSSTPSQLNLLGSLMQDSERFTARALELKESQRKAKAAQRKAEKRKAAKLES